LSKELITKLSDRMQSIPDQRIDRTHQ